MKFFFKVRIFFQGALAHVTVTHKKDVLTEERPALPLFKEKCSLYSNFLQKKKYTGQC